MIYPTERQVFGVTGIVVGSLLTLGTALYHTSHRAGQSVTSYEKKLLGLESALVMIGATGLGLESRRIKKEYKALKADRCPL